MHYVAPMCPYCISLMPSLLPTCLLSRLGGSARFFVTEVYSELFDDALQVLDGRDFIAHRFIAMSSRFCRTSKGPGYSRRLKTRMGDLSLVEAQNVFSIISGKSGYRGGYFV